MQQLIHSSDRIWLDANDLAPDVYVRFRRTFTLDQVPANAELSISVDTEFMLLVNGIRVPITQFPDYPRKKTYTTTDIATYLRPGRNVLAVLVHHFGYGNATHPLCRAGLCLALLLSDELVISSDKNWRVSLSEAYASGQHQLLTVPIGFRFDYDATKEENWTEILYDDSEWCEATVLCRPASDGSWEELLPRPVPCLIERPPTTAHVVWQGETLQLTHEQDELGDEEELAEPFLRYRLPENAFADWQEGWNCRREDSTPYPFELIKGESELILMPPSQSATGVSIIIDLQRETVGYLSLKIENDNEGEINLEVHHGEHLDDCRVRSRVIYARFIDTYRLKRGTQDFTHTLRRIGARYLQLFLFGDLRKPIKIHYAGLIETRVPLAETRPFKSDYALQAPVRDLAIHTLVCCMHDHYEDCPWREQSLYAYDSRNQILYGYYLWGNYDFVQASLELLAGNYFKEIGYLALCAPSDDKMTIPAFTYVWIVEVSEFVLYSGRIEFFRKHQALIDDILHRAIERPDKNYPGLFSPGDEDQIWKQGTEGRVWNFYEWCHELANDQLLPQALYNAYLLEAIQAAITLHDWAGNADQANEYRQYECSIIKAINRYFWNEDDACYLEFILEDRPHQRRYEHVQVLMLWLGVVPDDRRARLVDKILQGQLEPCTFSSLLYSLLAMMRETSATRVLVEKRLKDAYEPILRNNATTLWELPCGGNTGRFGGSLCHGWSAIPVYYAGACNLGVYPVAPGFNKFIVKPYPGKLKFAEGRVPTPYGDITVSWRLSEITNDLDISVSAPEGLEYKVFQPHEFDRRSDEGGLVSSPLSVQ